MRCGVLEAWKRFVHCGKSGFRPEHSIELLIYSEEPTALESVYWEQATVGHPCLQMQQET